MVLSPRFAWYQTPGNGNATHRICLYWFPRKIACQPALSRHIAFSGVRERSLPLEVSTFRQISPSDLLTVRPYKSSRVCADQCAASPRRGDGIPDCQYLPSGADLHSVYVHPWGDLSRNRTDLGTACGGCLVSAVGYWAVFPHVGQRERLSSKGFGTIPKVIIPG